MRVAGQLERLKPGQVAGHWLADAGRGAPQTAIQRFCARVALSLLAWKKPNIRQESQAAYPAEPKRHLL